MKVVMIDNFLPESNYSLEVSKELQNEVDLMLFCRTNAGNIDGIVPCRKVMYECGYKNKAVAAVSYLSGLHKLKEYANSCDVIHIQTFKSANIEIPIYLRLQKQGKCLVHTVHNIVPHEKKKNDWKLYGKLYRACNQLIVHNERTRKQLISDFDISGDRISIIPHGIYGEIVPNEKKKGEECTLLMFGLIREYKGLDILLKAITYIKPEIREKCRFIVAGNQIKKQNSIDYIAMAKKLGVENCVEFIIRYIENEELPELFVNSDACLFPYREIYGSGALLMAYTYQKPVIASNVPTFIEETENGKTGLLFENENPQSLAEAIERFVNLNDQQRKSYSDYIAKLVNEKYNWAASAKKTVEAYEKALQAHIF